MVVFPNCKINIGLNITGKRADGFHDLQTIFYPVPLRDALEIIEAGEEKFIVTGNTFLQGDNICTKAISLLRKKYSFPSLHVHLHKAIPVGAGLGGGSADGAFMLKLINDKFDLHISDEELLNYALELGSDCPFFILNKPSIATGRGEKLTAVDVDLSAYDIVLINPGIHVNTGLAFSQLTTFNKPDLEHNITLSPDNWKDHITNDFEQIVFAQHPQIAEVKDSLYNTGAIYASMSGTGSTVYGLFEKGKNPTLNFLHYFIKWL